MGFDNECIVNIQSLAGEYFCPVCRLLVYPNEALQSPCTHLYCKPCLTYVVGTTRACPYDGYLVTEADSKLLVESNNALAETIGKVLVHCLYQKSGCTWQGALSDSPSHCTGCAFGNSPVVCNRCGIQIVHRQVQEHAQNCPGVQQLQVQQSESSLAPAAASTALTGGQAVLTSQANTSKATATPAQHTNQQVGSNPETQAEWYQQQYQQYYQQYSSYNLHQQYPYQQQAVVQNSHQHLQSQPSQQDMVCVQPQIYAQPQVQSQTQPQLQPQPQAQGLVQPQSHPVAQAAPASQSLNQATVTLHCQTNPSVLPYSQVPSQTYPPSQSHANLQALPYSDQHPVPHGYSHTHVQHTQTPQCQQLPGQLHHPLPHSQTNSIQINQPPYPAANVVTGHQSYPQPQPTQQTQFGVSPSNMPVHHQGGTHQAMQPIQAQNQYPQQLPNLRPPQSYVPIPNQQPAMGQFLSIPPTQQPLHRPISYQPVISIHQHPLVQAVQQSPLQQPLVEQASGTIHNQMHQRGTFMHQQVAMQSQLRPQGQPQLSQQRPLSMPPPRPVMANHESQPQPQSQSQPQPQPQPHQHSAGALHGWPAHLGPNHPAAGQGDVWRIKNQLPSVSEGQSKKQGDHIAERGWDDGEAKSISDAAEVKSLNTETDTKSTEETKVKEIPKSEQISGTGLVLYSTKSEEPVTQHMVREEAPGSLAKSPENPVLSGKETNDGPLVKATPPQEAYQSEEKMGIMNKDRMPTQMEATSVTNQRRNQQPIDHGCPTFLLGAVDPSTLQAQRRALHPLHTPGQPPTVFRPHGPEVFPSGSLRPAPAPSFDSGVGRYCPGHHISEGPYIQGQPLPFHNSKISSNLIKSTMPFGLRDEWFKPFPDEQANPISVDSARHKEFEEEMKHFPSPPHWESDHFQKSRGYIPSLRPSDRGFDLDVPPRPHEKYGIDFDTGANLRFLQERSLGLHEDGKGGSEASRIHPDFLGTIPEFGRRHIDAPRSSHGGPGVGFLGMDAIDGSEPHRFGFPGHLHGREFEGPAAFRMGEHFRGGDMIGLDFLPSHIRRGDHLGRGGFLGHLGVEEQVAFSGFPPRRPGEPGFRSRFSLQGFPDGSRPFAGDVEPFENLRKRKPTIMGWCRICKVDCETVEGLDLHSQTKEHQKRSMDMVAMIKQNAKKHKPTSADHAHLGVQAR